MVVAWGHQANGNLGGFGRVGILEEVDKPGRWTLQGVAGPIICVVDQQGMLQRACRGRAEYEIHRDESYRRHNIAGKIRVPVEGGVGEGEVLEVGRKGFEVDR